MEIYKKYRFEAAHRLPNVAEDHKCYRLHGHSFETTIYVDGPMDADFGWVIDFADISEAVRPIIKRLDHYYLNEIEGLENPTSENIARWIWRELKPAIRYLSKVVVSETCTSGCVYQGE